MADIVKAVKRVVPQGLKEAVHGYTHKPDVISTKPDTFGNTYKQVGPLHILKKQATPETRAIAAAPRRAEKAKMVAERKASRRNRTK